MLWTYLNIVRCMQWGFLLHCCLARLRSPVAANQLTLYSSAISVKYPYVVRTYGSQSVFLVTTVSPFNPSILLPYSMLNYTPAVVSYQVKGRSCEAQADRIRWIFRYLTLLHWQSASEVSVVWRMVLISLFSFFDFRMFSWWHG